MPVREEDLLILSKNSLTYMDESNRNIVRQFLDCKERILGAGTNRELSRKNEEHLDYLFGEFSETSQQMEILCTELLNYVKSARKARSSIKQVTNQNTRKLRVGDYKIIFKELQSLKTRGGSLLEKIGSLRERHEQMLKRLTYANQKLHRELQISGAFKTFTNMMFITAKASLLICAILAAVLASDPHVQLVLAVVSTTCEVISSGTHWITKMTKDWEDTLKAHQVVYRSIQRGTWVAINDLDDIEVCINKVLREIDTLLPNGHSDNIRGEEGSSREDRNHKINKKLDSFLTAVESLKKKTEECLSNIENSRSDVANGYASVKKRLRSLPSRRR